MSADMKEWIEERLVKREDIDLDDLADVDVDYAGGKMERILGWGDVIKFRKKFYGVVQLKRTPKIAAKYGHFNLVVELNTKEATKLFEKM